ncbi:hypothetical protein AMJ44_08200 [candidate division WOR-1 bacterium DG_54_3]|uniref:Cation/H+ exchanger transmembrane domain-containing protein n=1 Tax=candidate division WOR-1 bacterium DG_54_3 TaxID=1703775 RepID=A0A0S7XWC3_UNCSA|nr:MAG: hypothetical protein AMJ44_08200 [candidate division WOR-1 bacterium DG_54_3]
MGPLFNLGIILLFGYLGGLIAERLKLPRIVGYILIGILLEPSVLGILPADFISNSIIANNFALAIITFSIGSSLALSKIRQLGKSILWITVFEAEFAFILVAIGMALVMGGGTFWQSLPLALLIAALASPTDPTAILAVVHEYRADGPVTRTLMGVAASDDALGIMNFSLATAFASALLLGGSYLTLNATILHPLLIILGSILIGVVLGIILSMLAKIIDNPGALIAIVFGMLCACFGATRYFGLDELLSTMTVGIAFVNLSRKSGEVFSLISSYFEEMIFIIFFVLAGAHLRFDTLASNWVWVLAFVILRTAGKFSGTFLGSKIAGAEPKVKKFAAYGLLPQGGIVVGLALLARQDPHFQAFGTVLVSLILGTTVIHEFLGPIFTKFAISRAGEMGK